MPHKFVIAVLMEYIRSLNQFQIPVQVPSNQHWWLQVRGTGNIFKKSQYYQFLT